MQFDTGYRLEVATVRKLETENDAFAFGDKLIEKWYKTVEQGDKKGILLLVTSAKEGALTGGPAFMKVPPTHSLSDVLHFWLAMGEGGGHPSFVNLRHTYWMSTPPPPPCIHPLVSFSPCCHHSSQQSPYAGESLRIVGLKTADLKQLQPLSN